MGYDRNVVAQLQNDLAKCEEARAMAVNLLVALILDKHCGRAFVSMGRFHEVQAKPYGTRIDAQPQLGNIAVTVLDGQGVPCTTSDASPAAMEKPGLIVAPVAVEAAEPEIRCPHCGRKIGHNLDCPDFGKDIQTAGPETLAELPPGAHFPLDHLEHTNA